MKDRRNLSKVQIKLCLEFRDLISKTGVFPEIKRDFTGSGPLPRCTFHFPKLNHSLISPSYSVMMIVIAAPSQGRSPCKNLDRVSYPPHTVIRICCLQFALMFMLDISNYFLTMNELREYKYKLKIAHFCKCHKHKCWACHTKAPYSRLAINLLQLDLVPFKGRHIFILCLPLCIDEGRQWL